MSWALTKQRSRRFLIAAGLCAGTAVVVVALFARAFLFRDKPAVAAETAVDSADKKNAQAASNTVVLTEEKLKAAGVRLEKAKVEELHADVVVSGMFEYDLNRKVNIQTRVPGIVRSVFVVQGDKVKAGDPLIILDSPDAGTARLEVQRRLRELTNAKFDADWKSTVAANVGELLQELAKGTPAPKLEKIFDSRDLGSTRAALLSAYADWEIARHEEEVADLLVNKNVYGEHKATFATHTREGLQAKYVGLREQTRFDVKQQKLLADQQVKNSEAYLLDARQRLRLLGVTDDPALLDMTSISSAELGAYSIVAPFDGTIIMRSAVLSQRVEPLDTLFTLADLTKIRVVANVPESDFAALSDLGDQHVRVAATALADRMFEAKIIDVSKEVDQKTRTIRLLGEIDNHAGLLRANMFARNA